MRKIDELGVDNTVRGAKVAWQSDPFAVTLVGGVANPSRVDEATGQIVAEDISRRLQDQATGFIEFVARLGRQVRVPVF